MLDNARLYLSGRESIWFVPFLRCPFATRMERIPFRPGVASGGGCVSVFAEAGAYVIPDGLKLSYQVGFHSSGKGTR